MAVRNALRRWPTTGRGSARSSAKNSLPTGSHRKAACPIRDQQVMDEGKPMLAEDARPETGAAIDLSNEKVRLRITRQWKANSVTTEPPTYASATGSATSGRSAT